MLAGCRLCVIVLLAWGVAQKSRVRGNGCVCVCVGASVSSAEGRTGSRYMWAAMVGQEQTRPHTPNFQLNLTTTRLSLGSLSSGPKAASRVNSGSEASSLLALLC